MLHLRFLRYHTINERIYRQSLHDLTYSNTSPQIQSQTETEQNGQSDSAHIAYQERSTAKRARHRKCRVARHGVACRAAHEFVSCTGWWA